MVFDSLDPRINRLNLHLQRQEEYKSVSLDQLPTYEVFLQLKPDKEYQHAGIVHAATPDTAFLFAKEQFSRRYTCTGMWVVSSSCVWVTQCMELEESIYDHLPDDLHETKESMSAYDIFHLYQRGKQHKHAGKLMASGHGDAVIRAKQQLDQGKPVLNIWSVKTSDVRTTGKEDLEIWSTLPQKSHREVISYRAGEKLKLFKEKKHGPPAK